MSGMDCGTVAPTNGVADEGAKPPAHIATELGVLGMFTKLPAGKDGVLSVLYGCLTGL